MCYLKNRLACWQNCDCALNNANKSSNLVTNGSLFSGQVADAISTPLIGYGSDKNFNHFICRYGRRKIWHLIGSICVSCSFPFIFNACFVCDDSELWIKLSYYSVFIALFQFGWACVQVSHVSLITGVLLTLNYQCERTDICHSFQHKAICVWLITWIRISLN